jgi:hypothetical protein
VQPEERSPAGIVICSNCGLDGRDRIKADRIATLAAIFFRDIGEIIIILRAAPRRKSISPNATSIGVHGRQVFAPVGGSGHKKKGPTEAGAA